VLVLGKRVASMRRDERWSNKRRHERIDPWPSERSPAVRFAGPMSRRALSCAARKFRTRAKTVKFSMSKRTF
jgi:phosphoenolpyruvate synthase/pyruvate phosphate dikinase